MSENTMPKSLGKEWKTGFVEGQVAAAVICFETGCAAAGDEILERVNVGALSDESFQELIAALPGERHVWRRYRLALTRRDALETVPR